MNTEIIRIIKTNGLLRVAGLLVAGLLFTSCQTYRNFTTYYNRFWNMERIMAEVEDEVSYARSQQAPPKPRYYVPYDELKDEEFFSEELNRRTLTPEEVKANKIKLDSIILKGSTLLSLQAKSDYVDDAIFYISKAYFYMREWYQSQEQAQSLIDNFPDSKWQPDAHLIVAMDLLKQGEVAEAEKMLSKTVDIAFKFKRQDVLTQAFRLNADARLAQGNTDQAIKPYERAILLSDDGKEKARWQYEIGVVHFRAGDFQKSIEAFDKVKEYDPDELTEFETGLQKSVALRTLKDYDKADEQLKELAEEKKFLPWQGIVQAEQMSVQSDRSGAGTLSPEALAAVDSAGGKEYALYGVYERAVRAFLSGEYQVALTNFSSVQASRTPFQKKAHHYTVWLTYYNEQYFHATEATKLKRIPFPDSLAQQAADAYYNIARFFVTFNVKDSVEPYYRLSLKWAPQGSFEGARSLYALSSLVRAKGNGVEADSLLDILANKYGSSPYAKEAQTRLGYTGDFIIDSVKDLYMSGRSLMLNTGAYHRALERFDKLVKDYSWSDYAPQALYASGLIYEQYLKNPDSALYYYSLLLERYPASDQAKAVRPIVDATLAARSGKDTVKQGGLVPLKNDQDGTTAAIDPNKQIDTAAAPTVIPWYTSALYDPVPELAMERREKRTLDEP